MSLVPSMPLHVSIRALAMLLFWGAAILPGGVRAMEPSEISCCQALDEGELQRARQAMEQNFLYACCDDTVAACLKESEPCNVAERVAGEICRRVGAGETDEEIAHAIKRRARTMIPGGPKADIDAEGAPSVGAEDAPVVIVEYACVRCPFCSKLSPVIEEEIRSGSLEGKVRMVYKLFPIKGHEGSIEAGLAALAAHEQDRFWAFLDHAYAHFDSFSVDVLDEWAKAVGLDLEAWKQTMEDPATRQKLVESKKEGMANGVDATPTFFLNGRLYQSDLEKVQILDILMEEYERVTGDER